VLPYHRPTCYALPRSWRFSKRPFPERWHYRQAWLPRQVPLGRLVQGRRGVRQERKGRSARVSRSGEALSLGGGRPAGRLQDGGAGPERVAWYRWLAVELGVLVEAFQGRAGLPPWARAKRGSGRRPGWARWGQLV